MGCVGILIREATVGNGSIDADRRV